MILNINGQPVTDRKCSLAAMHWAIHKMNQALLSQEVDYPLYDEINDVRISRPTLGQVIGHFGNKALEVQEDIDAGTQPTVTP